MMLTNKNKHKTYRSNDHTAKYSDMIDDLFKEYAADEFEFDYDYSIGDIVDTYSTKDVNIDLSEKIEYRKQKERQITVCKNVIKRINESTNENNHSVPSLTMKKHIDELFEFIDRLYKSDTDPLTKEEMENINEIAHKYPVS